jgi:hypothetical protein
VATVVERGNKAGETTGEGDSGSLGKRGTDGGIFCLDVTMFVGGEPRAVASG